MARRCIDIELGGNLITSSVLTNLDSLPTNIGSTAYNLYNQRAVPSFISSYGYVVGDISLSNYSYASANNDITLVGERDGNDGTVTCTVYNAGNQYFTFTYFSLNVAYYNPTAWAGWVVDDDNLIGWVLRIVKLPSFMGDQYIVDVYGGDTITYNALHGAVPVLYNWSSVPAISGKMGILSCPALYEDSDGNPVTDGTRQDFAKLPDSSLLSQLCQKIYNDEQIIAYSGEDNKLSCTWTSATAFTLKWYIQDVQIASISYTLANASDDVWIHMLFDKSGAEDPEQHAWARPSIVIRNSVTGYYSWNTESVDSGLFDTFYEWIYGSQKDWGDAILGDFNEEAGGDDYSIPSDDPIPEPAMPTISSLNLNMTKMYKCTKDIINSFWTWLCDDNVQIGNKLFTADPLQGVIGINIVPFDISADGNPEICYLGLHTNVYAPRVTDQFQEIDCGTFKVPKYMYGTYLDYSPFTKIKCVIPYIGIIDLDTDDVSGKTLQLKLRYDVLTGICIAHLYVNNALHYEAAGNININVPMTQKDYTQIANTIKGVISRLGGSTSQAIGMGAISGNAAAAGVGIGSSLVASGLELAMAKPSYRYIQGGAGASAAFMGIDRPFLLFQIPTLARPEADEKFIGMPSYIKDKIGSFKGFAKFKNPHIDNVACTASEKAKIEQFLQAGIINQVGTDKESTTPSNTPTTTGNTVITFIKNQSDNNVMGKTFNTTQHAIEGKLLYDHSITQPVFLISGNVIDYNYAYIGDFNRFYYITDVITKAHGMCEVHFDCDVLQSFKASIKECDGICERSQNRNNMYINDNALITQQNAYVFTKQFSKTGVRFNFAKGNACYTLVLADA